MPIACDDFIDHCLASLSDTGAAIWARTKMLMWTNEAIQAFPILRPMYVDSVSALATRWYFRLPTDFREVISVEYPVGNHPVDYLIRKNRLDPSFYDDENHFDIDNDYTTGDLYQIYFSVAIPVNSHVYVQYLASHDATMADDGASIITIPDEYETILLTFVLAKAYRERLSYHLQNPTVQATIISQLTDMVNHLEEKYNALVAEALAGLSESKITPRWEVDKHDRVY